MNISELSQSCNSRGPPKLPYIYVDHIHIAMAWTQHDDGYWTRPLDYHDKTLEAVGEVGNPYDHENWLIMVTTRPRSNDLMHKMPLSRLQNVWKALRFQHPDIAPELHDAWCNATCRVHADVRSADELFAGQLYAAAIDATCHWVLASCQLVLVSS